MFISSVIDGFGTVRAAVRRGIEKAGAEPVMVEDLSAQAHSPRNTCLDLVDSCDVYIVIVGGRGGWTAPSGKKVTEEEYEHALRKGKPILAFIQTNVVRDVAAELLANRLSDYVTGHYRQTFASTVQLEDLVHLAVSDFVPETTVEKNDPQVVMDVLAKNPEDADQAWIRIAFIPERKDELIDPLALETPDLRASLYEIGHASAVGLFSYEIGKSHAVGVDTLTLTQRSERSVGRREEFITLALNTDGMVVIEANITGRGAKDSDTFFGYQPVDEEDVAEVLGKQFAFTAVFYDRFDRHVRLDRFSFNAALGGIEHREWRRGGKKVAGSYALGWNQPDRVLAFDQPRSAIRSEIRDPTESIQRVLTMLRRRIESQK